jgi:hypothetical protein
MQKNKKIIKESFVYHIAGITDLYKSQLITALKNMNMYVIYDLDIETEKIYKLKEIQNKLKDFNTLKPAAKKKVELEITEIWKEKLNEYIKKTIKENEVSRQSMSFIIFIGNITSGSFSLMGDKSSVLHVKHMKTKINIPADEKFFLKVNLKQNAQEIIKFNLKKYHDDIVEGEFPLEFINLDFLINTREQLQNVYENQNKYTIFPLDKIIYYFQYGIHEKKPDLLYVVLPEEHEKIINVKKKIYGFTEDWIALSSLASGIEYGYNDGIPFLKEKIKGSFKKLEIDCYIYVVQSTNFLPSNYDSSKNNKMKFVTEKQVKIIKSLKIENIRNKLKDMKIKFV